MDSKAAPVEPPRPAAPSVPSFEEAALTRQEYIAAIVHLYRGELSRANTWRTRLDATTNWAIGACAVLLSYTFSDPTHSHVVLLFGFLLVGILLAYEARRFRFFDVWRARVRMIEENFYGPILRRDLVSPRKSWGRLVAHDLLSPGFKISFIEAFRARLARNYLPLFLLLSFAWATKVAIHPNGAGETGPILQNIARGQGGLSWIVPVAALLLFNGVLTAVLFFVRAPETTDQAYWPREEEEEPISALDA